MLTFHGDAAAQLMPKTPVIEGTVFQTSSKLRGIHPDWYQTAFDSESAIEALMAPHFSEWQHIRQGFGYQDLVWCRKSSPGDAAR